MCNEVRSIIVNMIRKILKSPKKIVNATINYLKEVRFEVRKVTWPNRKEVIRYTLVVIAVSSVVAMFLGGLDFILITLLNRVVL